jgi:hypothetical protein
MKCPLASFFVGACSLIPSLAIAQTDCLGRWEGNGVPGVSGNVVRVEPWNHDADPATPDWLIVFGDEAAIQAGDVSVQRVAIWDGQQWMAFETIVPQTVLNGYAHQIATDRATGELWLVSGRTLFRRDPQSQAWTNWPIVPQFRFAYTGPVPFQAKSLAAWNGNLYAIGYFQSLDPEQPNSPYALYRIVDGQFIEAALLPPPYSYNLIAREQGLFLDTTNTVHRFDGNQFVPLIAHQNGGFSQLEFFQGQPYVVTPALNMNCHAGARLIRLTTDGPEVLADTCTNPTAFAVLPDGVYFAGRGGILPTDPLPSILNRWNGAEARPMPSSLARNSYALAAWNGSILSYGRIQPSPTLPPLEVRGLSIAHWQNGLPDALGEGFNAGISALEIHDGQLFAAGDFTRWGDTLLGNVARWTGSSWTPTSPVYSGFVPTDMLSYAGSLLVADAGRQIRRLANGQWQVLSSITGSTMADLRGDLITGDLGVVRRLPAGQSQSVVVGQTALASGSIGQIKRFRVIDGRLYIIGAFDSIAGEPVSSIAAWNGDTFEPVWSQPVGDQPLDIVRFQGQLYMQRNSGVYRLDAETWTPIAFDYIYTANATLLPHDGRLYSLGLNRFFIEGPGPSRAAWFDGANWHPMTNARYAAAGTIKDAVFFGSQLHVAGDFVGLINPRTLATLGQRDLAFYARWTPPPACDPIDFNNDGTAFDPTDIDAFLSVFSEGPCIPAGATCNDIDFNNDCSLYDPEDIDAFIRVFSEGTCLP